MSASRTRFYSIAPPQKPSLWGEGGAPARRMRGKCPEGWRYRKAARRGQDPSLHYQPAIFAPPQNRGRGMPRPYRAFFKCARGAGTPYLLSIIYYLLSFNTPRPRRFRRGRGYLTAPSTKMPSGARFRGLQKIPAGACPP